MEAQGPSSTRSRARMELAELVLAHETLRLGLVCFSLLRHQLAIPSLRKPEMIDGLVEQAATVIALMAAAEAVWPRVESRFLCSAAVGAGSAHEQALNTLREMAFFLTPHFNALWTGDGVNWSWWRSSAEEFTKPSPWGETRHSTALDLPDTDVGPLHDRMSVELALAARPQTVSAELRAAAASQANSLTAEPDVERIASMLRLVAPAAFPATDERRTFRKGQFMGINAMDNPSGETPEETVISAAAEPQLSTIAGVLACLWTRECSEDTIFLGCVHEVLSWTEFQACKVTEEEVGEYLELQRFGLKVPSHLSRCHLAFTKASTPDRSEALQRLAIGLGCEPGRFPAPKTARLLSTLSTRPKRDSTTVHAPDMKGSRIKVTSRWGLGFGDQGKGLGWWLCRKNRAGQWRVRAKVRIPAGDQQAILETILSGHGSAELPLLQRALGRSSMSIQQFKNSTIKYALSKINSAVREAMAGVGKGEVSKKTPPITLQEGTCRAIVSIGTASREDGKITFQPADRSEGE